MKILVWITFFVIVSNLIVSLITFDSISAICGWSCASLWLFDDSIDR
jgi:hypothetical protein